MCPWPHARCATLARSWCLRGNCSIASGVDAEGVAGVLVSTLRHVAVVESRGQEVTLEPLYLPGPKPYGTDYDPCMATDTGVTANVPHPDIWTYTQYIHHLGADVVRQIAGVASDQMLHASSFRRPLQIPRATVLVTSLVHAHHGWDDTDLSKHRHA